MTYAVIIFCSIIAAVILAEIISRIGYRLYFHLPFQDKRIAEYPYSRFLEQTDSLVHCVFKKGFRSPEVNINSFGLRGDEPAPNGAKRRILVVGESNFFGAKLRDERRIWSKQLQRLLAYGGHGDWEVINGGHGDWEVINGGTPLYGSSQHWHFWNGALAEVNPDILVVGIGGNDVAQMGVLGERWHPGAHWPFEFLLKMERKGTWWNSILGRYCLYFFLRRFLERQSLQRFPKGKGELPWEACKRNILDQYGNFCSYARQNKIKIIFTNSPPLYNEKLTKEDERRLWAIQSSFRDSVERDGPYFADLKHATADGLCGELDVPYWDLKADFMANPRCFSCWYDMGHWNEKGMAFVARSLYNRIEKLGWWT